MFSRRSLFAAAALGTALVASAGASASERFTQAKFDAARAAGKSVLVEVSAPWCPTCKAQKPILSNLAASPKFKDVVMLDVDFDSQKDVLRALNVRQQSTLISFKGNKETGRSTGDTNAASIESLIAASL